MILSEFDEEKFAKSFFDQGKAEGIKEGIIKGKAEGFRIGKAEGFRIGKAEGIEESSRQIVIRMIQNNCSDQVIHSIVPAYSLEEIQKLREDCQRDPEKYLEVLN